MDTIYNITIRTLFVIDFETNYQYMTLYHVLRVISCPNRYIWTPYHVLKFLKEEVSINLILSV